MNEDSFFKELKQAYSDANVAEILTRFQLTGLCLAALLYLRVPAQMKTTSVYLEMTQNAVNQFTKSQLRPSMQGGWPWWLLQLLLL